MPGQKVIQQISYLLQNFPHNAMNAMKSATYYFENILNTEYTFLLLILQSNISEHFKFEFYELSFSLILISMLLIKFSSQSMWRKSTIFWQPNVTQLTAKQLVIS